MSNLLNFKVNHHPGNTARVYNRITHRNTSVSISELQLPQLKGRGGYMRLDASKCIFTISKDNENLLEDHYLHVLALQQKEVDDT